MKPPIVIDDKEDIKGQKKRILIKNLKEEEDIEPNKKKEEDSHPRSNKKMLEPLTEQRKKEKEREIKEEEQKLKEKEKKEEEKIYNGQREKEEKKLKVLEEMGRKKREREKEFEENERRKKIEDYVKEKKRELEENERKKKEIEENEKRIKKEIEENERKKKEIEENEKRIKKEKEENERRKKEEEEEQERKKKQINLYLLLKNFEAVKKDIEKLRENIHQIFDSYRINLNEGQDINKIKEGIIAKVLNAIIEYLELDKSNGDEDIIKEILEDSYEEKGNINEFEDYLDVILNSVNDFYNITNKNEIINFIFNYLSMKEGILENLLSQYQKVDFIDYEEFSNITKENQIAMDEIAIEYLIFRMKINEPGKTKMKFRQLNIQAFFKFFDANILKEDNQDNI